MHPRASRAARVMNLRRPECEEQRARLLQSEREEAYGRAFDALIGEQSVLEGLYAPLMARLGAAWTFLGTVRGALTQPVRQPVARPELLEEARDVVAATPATRRTFDAQHVELADQVADRSIGGIGAVLPRLNPPDQLGDCSGA
jgi:hypothetical protein